MPKFQPPTKEQAVFKKWNEYSSIGRWVCHREIKPDIIDAIKFNTKKGWTIQDMCDAIVNFANAIQNKDCRWTYNEWSLAQFLTRGKKENDLRWVWFHPNNFRASDWLTEKAVVKRIESRKQQQVLKSETPQEKQWRESYMEKHCRK